MTTLNTATPIRVTTANTDWAKRGDHKYVKYLCGFSDVILFQEGKDYTLKDILPKGWTAYQDLTDAGTRGACIAVRDGVKVLDHGIVLGSKPIILGKRVKMLVRWIYWVHVEFDGHQYFLVSAHEPPGRFKALQPHYEDNLERLLQGHAHAIVGTDANHPLTALADRLLMIPSGVGIVGLLTRHHLRVVATKVTRWGINENVTDHPSVTIHVLPVGVKSAYK